ncbi:hypothetical protein TPHA_0O00490 [Tetrapisispora phaffii CBS 4417]|uniref:Fumarate reductase n=1 Tax=Tetrapisispora phaffii (strain ATCC 24235 / CBS 4417 / NBRC 1672 / NRRL Y-8282 / UCD 70-5) TaxID=1071381 RepID=G8C1J1_TETPH|nr:hypothetical protein TPHA_0O00490 [Tetrapisispora phaffii CBS 4417]CCE66019.1 hypothetical protein TPHA_0O00490 [Tetrapisispora phaffii CBS 4417]
MPRLRKILFYLVVLVSFFLVRRSFVNDSGKEQFPVVVIGSGLAGLSAVNQLLNDDVPAVLLDKASSFGGNSVKAASGISGAGTSVQKKHHVEDSPELFLQDTLSSAKGRGVEKLMKVMADESAGAIAWLQERFGLKLDLLSQLGGQSVPRTHRSDGPLPPGAELVKALTRRIKNVSRDYPDKVKIQLDAKVTDIKINKETNRVEYVVYRDASNQEQVLRTGNVLVATGGFSYSQDMLKKYAPQVAGLPTTNCLLTTGDGLNILQSLGAHLVDMDQIQIHPTGFVDPKDRKNNWKFLAAEALRGLGGILVNPSTGKRFVNELETRDTVTESIRKACKKSEGVSLLVISENTFQDYKSSVEFYISKGLVQKMPISSLVSEYNLPISATEIASDLIEYSTEKKDKFDRVHKINTFGDAVTADTEVYVAEITPVVHFTMGGVKIDEFSQVLNESDSPVADGLYAAGEITYGVHGSNRLGGSSLLECVVFGRIAAQHISRNF